MSRELILLRVKKLRALGARRSLIYNEEIQLILPDPVLLLEELEKAKKSRKK